MLLKLPCRAMPQEASGDECQRTTRKGQRAERCWEMLSDAEAESFRNGLSQSQICKANELKIPPHLCMACLEKADLVEAHVPMRRWFVVAQDVRLVVQVAEMPYTLPCQTGLNRRYCFKLLWAIRQSHRQNFPRDRHGLGRDQSNLGFYVPVVLHWPSFNAAGQRTFCQPTEFCCGVCPIWIRCTGKIPIRCLAHQRCQDISCEDQFVDVFKAAGLQCLYTSIYIYLILLIYMLIYSYIQWLVIKWSPVIMISGLFWDPKKTACLDRCHHPRKALIGLSTAIALVLQRRELHLWYGDCSTL